MAGRSPPQSGEEAVKRAAVYEAWLVHLRNLITFFRDEQRYGDEVLACHFMAVPEQWAALHRDELKLSEHEEQRLEKIHHLVAHITYDRLGAVSDFGRPDQEIALRRLRLFYRDLPELHKARFRSLARLVT